MKDINPGMRIGDILVIGFERETKSYHKYYSCYCVRCGRYFTAETAKLSLPDNGKQCCERCIKKIDHTGKRIGDFMVIRETGNVSKSRNLMWLCRCTVCGREREVSSGSITSESKWPKCKHRDKKEKTQKNK